MDTWEYGYRLRPMVAIVAIVAIVAMVLVAIVAIVAIVAGSPDLSSGAPEFGSPDLSSGAADFFDTEEEEEDEREALLGEKKRAGSPDLSVGFAKKTKKTSSHTSTARLPQKLTMRQTELSVKDKIWWANRSCLYTRNKSKTPHLDAAKVANLDAASTRTFAQSIGKWARDLPKLINRLALHTGPASKLRRCVNPAPGLYPKAEAQVFAEFTARRKIGLPVGEMWFTIRMARFAKSAATAAAAVARCCCCSLLLLLALLSLLSQVPSSKRLWFYSQSWLVPEFHGAAQYRATPQEELQVRELGAAHRADSTIPPHVGNEVAADYPYVHRAGAVSAR